MKILKYFIIFTSLYFVANMIFWGYQEYIYYEDTQAIRALDTRINIDNTLIEEKSQSIQRESQQLNSDKEYLDQLIMDKKYAQYNELVEEHNQSIENYNESIRQYDAMIEAHNNNIKDINELLLKSATRKYLFPIPTYVPELYQEVSK
ncbi:MAG: hypothetical protein RLZZ223_145 [Candidatus Parcubacteria bacterium]